MKGMKLTTNYLTTSKLIELLQDSLQKNGDLPICIAEDSMDVLPENMGNFLTVEEAGSGHLHEELPKRLTIWP